MSMLSFFFNRGFVASKCKTLLKLTIPRIKLLRNRREMQLKQMRRDIAKLLETGQEATARIRVEHIIREENMMAAQEIIELFCELIVVRLPIIESQRECPLDLKEAISSVCFAAPRCADLPELLQVQLLFVSKYGKEFGSAATELMPDCGVNRQLIELLSVRAPSPEKKLKLLKEIASDHDLDWDSAVSETELFKKTEDLLNGPAQFFSESKLPLPEEKHNETSYLAPGQPEKEQPDLDSGSGSHTLEFPEVPKVPLLSNANLAAAPEMVTPPVSPPCEVDFHSSSYSGVDADIKQEKVKKRSIIYKEEPQASGRVENKQFVSFISPPSVSPGSFSARHSGSPSSLLREKTEADGDLQDVLAAAHAAAETAEQAAAAARSAASLAQVRPNELTKKSSECEPDSTYENPFYIGSDGRSATTKGGPFTEKNTAGDYDSSGMNYLEPDQDYDAAAAVKSVANLAQFGNSRLTKKNSECEPDSTYENPFYIGSGGRSTKTESGPFTEKNIAGDYDSNGMNNLEPDQDYDAAAAVKSIGSLAQVCNSELSKKNSECEPDSTSENPFYIGSANWSSTTEREHFAEKNTAGEYDNATAAAQSAASLAQIRISELTKKHSDCEPDGASENPFYTSSANESATERGHFTEKNTAGDHDGRGMNYNASPESQSSSFPSFDTHKPNSDSSLPNYQVLDNKSSSRRSKNLPSMDDDLYSSYHNLFSLPNSNVGSQTHSYNHRSNS